MVEPGGRILLTVPYADEYWEDWRDRPVYGSDGEAVRYFFERWYDAGRLDELLRSAPVREVSREVVRLQPNWNQAYNRHFPKLVPLGPFFGVLAFGLGGIELALATLGAVDLELCRHLA